MIGCTLTRGQIRPHPRPDTTPSPARYDPIPGPSPLKKGRETAVQEGDSGKFEDLSATDKVAKA